MNLEYLMHPLEEHFRQTRRAFLTSTAGGIGAAALTSLLSQDGMRAAEPPGAASAPSAPAPGPLTPKRPHFTGRATRSIFIYLYGGVSHIDLFDPKPKLNELDGQPLPASLTANVRFAFVQKETAKIMGSPRLFQPAGQCGTPFSDWLPHLAACADDIALIRSMHTEAFNHAPGELVTNTGVQAAGHPSVGAWITYGLGSESEDLPGFVVLVQGERDKAYNWSNGFLPSIYQGVRFRNQGEPLLNLQDPPGLTGTMRRSQLDAIGDLNRERYRHLNDPEIAARIAAYELAFRMQTAGPELIDLAGESAQTLTAYGADRRDADSRGFATHCLLARRLVERGVRYVNLIHSNWDQHKDLDKDLKRNCLVVDQPIAALVKDLKQRGLLETTLVVVATEFGRTPVSDNGQNPTSPNGRDHHPFAFSVCLAGGGVKGGQVIGRTDDLGWGIVEDPVHFNDFHATILHLFGLDHLKLTYRYQGRDFRLTDVGGNVVAKLLA